MFGKSSLHKTFANLQVTPNQVNGWEGAYPFQCLCRGELHKNNKLWERGTWHTKHSTETKRTVTLAFLSSIWPAVDAGQHMKTPNFDGKSQTCQLLWKTSTISRGSLKMLIFLFQPLLSKFWGLSQDFRFSRTSLQGVLNIVGAWKNLAWIWNSAEKLLCHFVPLPISDVRSPLGNRPDLSGISIEKLED